MNDLAIRWAVHPAEQERIKQLPGIANFIARSIPQEGSTLTHPYLVDPETNQPCQLRVVQVMHGYPTPQEITIVVSRPQ